MPFKTSTDIKLMWLNPHSASETEPFSLCRSSESISSAMVTFSDVEQCINSIRSMIDEKIFLVTSGQIATTVLSRINHYDQLERVFIFCQNRDRHLHLTTKYPKVTDIVVSRDQLEASVQKHLRLAAKPWQTFVSSDQRTKALTNISEQMAEFLW